MKTFFIKTYGQSKKMGAKCAYFVNKHTVHHESSHLNLISIRNFNFERIL